MPRHLISDAQERINEIPTVPTYYLAKPQPRELAWDNQGGKKRQLCGVPLHGGYATLPGRCALKKTNAAEDRFVEVRRIQQFLWFRFCKGTNAELKMRSTLQQSAGLVVF